ncbi:MAG TPA: hypothetical protein VNX21_08595 [Candidatus Thermoplasmatota archaeon]|nr:hypothetical protein [Candidatus Thermoplasmatota archaeon]
MNRLLALPLVVLLAAAVATPLAPSAQAVACAEPSQGPGLVGATVYFVGKTVADNCNNTLWYGCYVATVLLGPGACPA